MRALTYIADMKLLIVDDSPLMRNRIASQALKLKGISIVGEAADGESAVIKFKELQPDFTIIDIHLPGMNGLELLQARSGT
jgi:YesN/AraC family two-component response regulator